MLTSYLLHLGSGQSCHSIYTSWTICPNQAWFEGVQIQHSYQRLPYCWCWGYWPNKSNSESMTSICFYFFFSMYILFPSLPSNTATFSKMLVSCRRRGWHDLWSPLMLPFHLALHWLQGISLLVKLSMFMANRTYFMQSSFKWPLLLASLWWIESHAAFKA